MRSYTNVLKQQKAASMVVDQGRSITQASKAKEVDASVMLCWVNQLLFV